MVSYQIDEVRTKVAQLADRLREILAARDQAFAAAYRQRQQEEASYQASSERLAHQLGQELQSLEAQQARERGQVAHRYERDHKRTEAAYARVASQVEEAGRNQQNPFDQQLRDGKQRAIEERDRTLERITEDSARKEASIQSLRAQADELREKIRGVAAAYKVKLRDEAVSEQDEWLVMSFEQAATRVAVELEAVTAALDSLRRRFWLRLMKRLSPLPTFLFLLVAHGLASAAVYHFALEFLYAVFTASSFLITGFLVYVVYRALRGTVAPAAAALDLRVQVLYALLARREVLEAEQLTRDRMACVDDYMSQTGELERSVNVLAAEEERKTKRIRQSLDDRYARLKLRVTVRKEAGLRDLERLSRERDEQFRAQHEDRLKQHEADHAARMQQINDDRDQETERLASEWDGSLRGLREFCEDAMNDSQQKCPPWSAPSWREWEMPSAFPEVVSAGKIQVDLAKIDLEAELNDRFDLGGDRFSTLPAVLSFPEHGSLVLSASASARSRGLEMLFNMTLRLLTSFPPGKAKLTILDPVGLGQNFSALMHLADYDESLVGGRIWTEAGHIEKRLAELTEHIEKVIQKYLRNRYASIGEYNREAGVMAEPYRFLVIADFPTGFSELALERLASIVTSGVRCGVYTLILHDRKQKVPDPVDLARLRANGLAVVGSEDGFTVIDDALNEPFFVCERVPDAHEITSLLRAIGQQCQDAQRIAVPFEAVAPQEGQYWGDSAESGLRVAIGQTGADRSQYLDIGRGTAQHVLVSGKTGSGKSTLFHVVITNLGLWFSPKEVELYLIDFKKGVEFKRFATHHLPHARVIAVESDREFGLSVLERIDREFTHRAELFRKAGVQDLASYRQSDGPEHLPRVLMIIDEFQEFFTEDDAVAQQAALLLDRIARQGRAFGVHMVLGSQTLGGAYTLAKSTIGQMAVRIALQCSEADSYLILSDDNSAARLLSRPGEAIYNDMSGLVEGNNPFQVMWLSDEVQQGYLRTISQRAKREGWRPAEPPVVFEGNVPAELQNNLLLTDRLSRTFDPATDVCEHIWLGEPNTIKDPTEARFLRQSGCNLLMVGQRSDAAIAIMAAAVFSLAARHAPGEIRIVILDGSPPDSEDRKAFANLVESVPHEVTLAGPRELPQIAEELNAEVTARQEGTSDARAPVYLMIFALQRLRKLRQEEEFSFSTDETDEPSPAKCFGNILAEGPEQGVHSVVWCDSLNNLNRTLNRKTLQEFEMRVLFQMSPTDSAELTDTPLASNLGLYKALLFVEADGIMEKFRPYGIPSPEVMAHLGEMLAARFS